MQQKNDPQGLKGAGTSCQNLNVKKKPERAIIGFLIILIIFLVFFVSGLLLQGDNVVQLVVLCAEKPTSNLLKRVVDELPSQMKKISEEFAYTISMVTNDGAIFVTDGTITVKVSLTSPLLRDQGILDSFLINMESFPISSYQFHWKYFFFFD